jgi:uncharacterized protein YbaR (Trm112 family)
MQNKRLLIKTKVVLREGLLEMLCCPVQTKEHESVLAVDAQAYVIHAGLLVLGAKPGTPVQYFPDFKPPTGQKIAMFLSWKDDKGNEQRMPAQQWVRHAIHRYHVTPLASLGEGVKIPEESDLRFDKKHKELLWYGPMTAEQRDEMKKLSKEKVFAKAIDELFAKSQSRMMKAEWVFAGSGFFVDEMTGEKFYEAEGGDLICVANFPSAMIDLGIESTASGEDNLLYECYTENIPPLETEVILELVPVFSEKE